METEYEAPLVIPGDSLPHPTPPLLVGSIWRQLNSLRVMRQYCLTLSRMCREYAFLQGHSITCVHGLEWFSSLNQPMRPLDDGVRAALDRTLNQAAVQQRGVSRERLAYELYTRLPCPDRDLLRLTIGLHFPAAREYEVDICRHMAVVEGLSYDQWLSRFFRWRSTGLYYPLAIAAHRMQTPEQWGLPSQLVGTPVSHAFFTALECMCTSSQTKKKSSSGCYDAKNCKQALDALVDAWEADNTGAAHSLASTLDRLAVLMRVKSNGRRENPLNFSLDDALSAFPVLSEQSCAAAGGSFVQSRYMDYPAWRSLKATIEDVFPPSTLCAPLTRPRRSTWGFPRLTLELLPGPVLRFKERSLALVPGTHDISVAKQQQQLPHQQLAPVGEHCVTFSIEKQAPTSSTGKKERHSVTFADETAMEEEEETQTQPPLEATIPHPSALFADCIAAQTSNRVQDVLWRLGELLLSPDIALCMLYPTVALASLDGSQDPVWRRYSELCLDREHLLENMTPAATAGEIHESTLIQQQHFERYLARLEACTPQVQCVHYDRPREVMLWRVDIPPRLLIYVGKPDAMHPASASRHHADKVLLNGKATLRTICRIVSLPPGKDPCSEDRVRDSLRAFAGSSLLDHPSNVVLVKGYGPVTSTTLAETLASLALAPVCMPTVRPLGQPPPRWGGDSIDERYAEKQVAPNGFRFRDWIAMHSTPSGTHQSRLAAHAVRFDALYHTKLPWLGEDGSVRWVRMASTSPPENRTLQGRTLRLAVESRYMHDLRMLPVRGQRDAVLRANAEMYADSPGSVSIVYAPTGDGPCRLELVAFQYPSDEGPYEGI